MGCRSICASTYDCYLIWLVDLCEIDSYAYLYRLFLQIYYSYNFKMIYVQFNMSDPIDVKTNVRLGFTVPPRYYSSRARGRTLEALDILGKWSLIDLFMICTMISAFAIKVNNSTTWSDIVILPPDFILVKSISNSNKRN